jgi:hypothetical protein
VRAVAVANSLPSLQYILLTKLMQDPGRAICMKPDVMYTCTFGFMHYCVRLSIKLAQLSCVSASTLYVRISQLLLLLANILVAVATATTTAAANSRHTCYYCAHCVCQMLPLHAPTLCDYTIQQQPYITVEGTFDR